jgi:uncharacterized protein
MNEVREFLGVGWKFPIQTSPNGKIAQSRYESRIEESIYLILNTAAGERVMLPNFGSGLHELVFAPNDAMTRSGIVQRVRQALVAYEPRIDVLEIDVENAPETPNLLLIRINYQIRANNTMGNLVYPFYLREGG